MPNAVLITGLFDGRCSEESLARIFENIVVQNHLDVFIYTNGLSLEHYVRDTWAPYLREFVNTVDTSNIHKFFTPKIDYLYTRIDAIVRNDEITSTMYHRKNILSVVDQHVRMIDGCYRLQEFCKTNGIQYDNVLRWRLDFVLTHPLELPVLKDQVWVLRLNAHETDRVHEFVYAEWKKFHTIYTTFLHYYLEYWPAKFIQTFSLIEIQFAQHLKALDYTYVEQRINFHLRAGPDYRRYEIECVGTMQPMIITSFVDKPLNIDMLRYGARKNEDDVQLTNTTEPQYQIFLSLFVACVSVLFVLCLVLFANVMRKRQLSNVIR